jgi:Ca-activated chloride channel family protein
MTRHLFAQPWIVWLLLSLPLLSLLAAWARLRCRRVLAQFGDMTALFLGMGRRRPWRWPRALAQSVGLTLLIVGAAGPQWGRDWSQTAAVGRDVVVVLDLSRSMLAEAPSRLARAKAALVDLSQAMQRRGGHRLALVAFAGQARVICPLTHDYNHFREALAGLDAAQPPPELVPREDKPSGTRLGQGLLFGMLSFDADFQGDDVQAAELLHTRWRQPVDTHAQPFRDVLLLSDGDDPAHDNEWRRVLLEIRKAGVPIHTIGIGDPQVASTIPLGGGELTFDGELVTTRLEEKPLQEIAERTGGTYTPAHMQSIPLGTLFQERIESRGLRDDQEASEDALPIYQQRYAWFLFAGLCLLSLEMLPNHIKLRWPRKQNDPHSGLGPVPAVCLLMTAGLLVGAATLPDAEALVRQGNAALDRGDHAAAVDYFTKAEERILDPGLIALNKGTALYRLGRVREAELHFRRCLEDAEGLRRARALYDLATCLVPLARGRDVKMLREAKRLYEACLEARGVSTALADDARHNLELTKLLIVQAIKAGPNPPEQGDENPPNKPPDPRTSGSESTGPDQKVRPIAVQPDPRGEPLQTDLRQPGAGDLPVIPDKSELTPLTQEDALAHAEAAAANVLRERLAYRIRSAKPAPAGVKDW